MTENEAKGKWCPEARITMCDDIPTNNRGNIVHDQRDFLCIASDCMMWRWISPKGSAVKLNHYGYCGKVGAI